MMFNYRAGSTGPETGRIQQRLIQLGKLGGDIIGTFDDAVSLPR